MSQLQTSDSNILKKGLIVVGVSAAASLLSYFAYKYLSEEVTSNNNKANNKKGHGVPTYLINDKDYFKNWKTYENEKLGINFKYPTKYDINLLSNNQLNQITLINTDKESASSVILVSVEDNLMYYNSLEYCQQNVELLKQQAIGQIKIISENLFVTNNQQRGVEIEFEIRNVDNQQTIKGYIASITQESKCYMFQHLISLGSVKQQNNKSNDFDIEFMRDLIRTTILSVPVKNSKAFIHKQNGISIEYPSSLLYVPNNQAMINSIQEKSNLFYGMKNIKNINYDKIKVELNIVRNSKDEFVKSIKIINFNDMYDIKNSYIMELQKLQNISNLKEMSNSITIDGVKGDIFTYENKKNELYHMDIWIKKNNNLYLISTFCKLNLFEQFKSEAITCIKSIKFNSSLATTLNNDILIYQNFEYNFKFTLNTINQMIHQFSGNKPIVSFSTLPQKEGTAAVDEILNLESSIQRSLHDLIVETSISVDDQLINIESENNKITLEKVKNHLELYNFQMLSEKEVILTKNNYKAFEFIYSTVDRTQLGLLSEESLVCMSTCIVNEDNGQLFTILSYTLSEAFSKEIEEIFKEVRNGFEFII
ncbi:hypothetical protein ABK040_001299 [Willaertia magna]